ncbi:hypothetical protein E2320_015426, partial [Naja naja]
PLLHRLPTMRNGKC